MPPYEPPTSATCGAGSAGAREVSGTTLEGGETRGAIIAQVCQRCAVVIACGGGAPSARRWGRGGAGAARRVASSFAAAGAPMIPCGRPHWSPGSPSSLASSVLQLPLEHSALPGGRAAARAARRCAAGRRRRAADVAAPPGRLGGRRARALRLLRVGGHRVLGRHVRPVLILRPLSLRAPGVGHGSGDLWRWSGAIIGARGARGGRRRHCNQPKCELSLPLPTPLKTTQGARRRARLEPPLRSPPAPQKTWSRTIIPPAATTTG